MNEVEIKLSKEEYKTFLKFLYFADYCASSGLISDFKDTDEKIDFSSEKFIGRVVKFSHPGHKSKLLDSDPFNDWRLNYSSTKKFPLCASRETDSSRLFVLV